MNGVPYNDKKIRNIQAIYLRNLFYESHHDEKSIGRIKSRRSTIFQPLDYSDDHAKLLQFNEKQLLTSFFSLHYTNNKIIYISDIEQGNSHPNFNQFCLPNIKQNKLDCLIIKVWIKWHQHWKLLIQWDCDLNKLIRINQDNINEFEYFKNNTIIIRLNDRHYTQKLNLHDPSSPSNVISAIHKRPDPVTQQLPGYTFDTIRSIINLDKSIKELQLAKGKIGHKIKKLHHELASFHDNNEIYNEILKYNIKIDVINKKIIKQKSTNDEILSDLMKFKILINNINAIHNEDQLNFIHNMNNEIEYIKNQIPTFNDSITSINNSIKHFLKSFSVILNEFLPINQQNLYHLSIQGIEFPANINTLLDILYYNKSIELSTNFQHMEHNNDHHFKILLINTAINYIIQVILIIIDITKLSVYYPIAFKGNYSIIKDFKNNEFPLFYDPSLTKKKSEFKNGTNQTVFKNELFETGINLLNKNLLLILKNLNYIYHEDLINNVPIDCLDNFLWNLQYLILFLSADTDNITSPPSSEIPIHDG